MPKKGRVAGARNIPELPHPFFQDKTLMLFGDQDIVKMIAMSAGHLPVVRTGRRIVAVRVDNVDGSVRTGTQNLHIGMRPAHLCRDTLFIRLVSAQRLAVLLSVLELSVTGNHNGQCDRIHLCRTLHVAAPVELQIDVSILGEIDRLDLERSMSAGLAELEISVLRLDDLGGSIHVLIALCLECGREL